MTVSLGVSRPSRGHLRPQRLKQAARTHFANLTDLINTVALATPIPSEVRPTASGSLPGRDQRPISP
jgi:hypothetical protein